jgi:hypothetical protein
MVATMSRYNHGQLVAPWLHGETLDDSVFRIAATFPLRQVKQHDYKIGGDELFGFDLNAFVQRLIDETGIPHVWERVLTAIPEGRRMYTYSSSHFPGQEPDPELDGKRLVRNLAWNIWKRFSPNLDEMLLSHCDKERASEIVATRFADFLLNNLDLVRQIESTFWIDGPAAFELAKELERRAQGGSSAGNAN